MPTSKETEIGSTGLDPGWHDGLEMDTYLDDPAVSASNLWCLDQNTPAHLLDELARERDTTKAKELGTVLHTAVLEPDELDSRYVILGTCEATVKKTGAQCTNSGKYWRDGQSFCGVKGHDPYDGAPEEEGIYTVAEGLKVDALAMRAALLGHRTAAEILGAPGPREGTFVWKDPETGLWCRIRPDVRIDEPPTTPTRYHFSTANLKSTGKSAHPLRYYRDAERMGTEFKAAFYRMGLRELWGIEPQNFFYPVVESTGSHQVIVYRMDDDALDVGEHAVRQALRDLAECVESGSWPGYGEEVHTLKISEYRTKHLHEIDFLEVA